MVNRTKRNDPCPCGSGKKYKKCCLPKDRIKSLPIDPYASGAFSRKERDSAIEKLPRFAMRPEFEEDWAVGSLLF